MVRSVYFSCIATLALGLSACSVDSRSATERAFASFEDRHFLDTRIHLANAIEKDPENPALRRLQGETALALGDGEVAETAFKKAIEIDSSLGSEINHLLAHAYLQQQKPDEALDLIGKVKDNNPYSMRLVAQANLQKGEMAEAWKVLENAMAIAPQDADILALAGQYQLSIGNISEAKRYADRAKESPKASVESYLLQGRIHSIEGKFKEALQQYDAASQDFRDHVRIYISKAAIHADNNDTEKMEEAIANIERISPGHQSAIYIMARHSLREGNIDKAYELAHELEGAAPNNAPILMLLGEIQVHKGNIQQSISHLRSLLRITPGDAAASFLLSKSLEKSGSYQEAAEIMARAVSRANSPKSLVSYAADLAEKTENPNLSLLQRRAASPALEDVQDQLNLAQKAIENGEWQTATNVYDALIAKSFANHPMLLNNAAMAHLRQGNGDRALALVERAYELTPDDPSVLDSLGWIRLNAAEDRVGSLQVLQRAFLLDPGNMQIRLHLAQSLALNGKKSEAKRHLQRVMAVVEEKHQKSFHDLLAKL